MFFAMFLLGKQHRFGDPKFDMKFGTLFEGLKYEKSADIGFYYGIFMARRLVHLVAILLLKDNPYTQLSIVILATLFVKILLIQVF